MAATDSERPIRGDGSAPGDDAPAAEVLLLGDPRLRRAAEPVGDPAGPQLARDRRLLQATLRDFRTRHGFGRAIAAPQIGVPARMVAAHLAGVAFVLHNPRIAWRSAETFTLWDDCMSFPELLVRVRRNRSISVIYTDERGAQVTLRRLDPATSELLQHELDHLDGVLAVDRAEGPEALVVRAAFEANPAHFAARVDGLPAP